MGVDDRSGPVRRTLRLRVRASQGDPARPVGPIPRALTPNDGSYGRGSSGWSSTSSAAPSRDGCEYRFEMVEIRECRESGFDFEHGVRYPMREVTSHALRVHVVTTALPDTRR